MNYGYKKKLDIKFRKAVEKTRKELTREGFGIITEIDAKAVLKKKLGVDFDNYVILGACNPKYAYQALKAERDVGLFLPCNVIVYEKRGKVFVSAINPVFAMKSIKSKKVDAVAKDVGKRLRGVMRKI